MTLKSAVEPKFEFIKVPEFDLRRQYEFPEAESEQSA